MKRPNATQKPDFQQPSILLPNDDIDSRDLCSIPKQCHNVTCVPTQNVGYNTCSSKQKIYQILEKQLIGCISM